MSETEKYLSITRPYVKGNVIDIGSQGYPIIPRAIQIDLPEDEFKVYCGHDLPTQPIWRCDGTRLPFKDETVDTVYSSHLLEDFKDWTPVLSEWIRVLKRFGRLIIVIPEDDLWKQAVSRGQPPNDHHLHCGRVGELTEHVQRIWNFQVLEDRLTACYEGDYSILFVGEKR